MFVPLFPKALGICESLAIEITWDQPSCLSKLVVFNLYGGGFRNRNPVL